MSEHHRLIIEFEKPGALGGEELSVKRFSINEGLSKLFSVGVVFTSHNHNIKLDQLIGDGATFTLKTNLPTEPYRAWAGIVDHVEQIHAENTTGKTSQSSYYAHISPLLWRLTQRRNHRIFQRLSLVDIVKKVFADWQIEATWELKKDTSSYYLKHDYVVQYGESDFDFVSRLLEWAGITYFFRFPGGDIPKLVLGDKPHEGTQRSPAIIAFDEPPENVPPEFCQRVRLAHTMQPTKVELRDYEFRREYNEKLRADSGKTMPKENVAVPAGGYEQYHYAPGHFLVDMKHYTPETPNADKKGLHPRHAKEEGERQAHLMMRALRKYKRVVRFETNCQDLAPGKLFKFDGHPRDDLEGKKPFLVSGFFLEGTAEGNFYFGGEASYTDVAWVPDRKTHKPHILGVQSALVVGPKGKELHTDEHGRVRVQFHWDREGTHDDNSSCWLRVSQDWAGAGWGSFMLPRVGHEVLVGFYEGDPDHPVVVGRVYNEFNKVPYKLPDHKTRSTWKSDSTPKGDGLNEIMMEDDVEKELFYMQAEKDLDKLVRKYETERTLKDRMQIVGNDRQSVVGELDSIMVGKRYLMQMMSSGKDDMKVQKQEDPVVKPEKTTIDMVDKQIIFTTGQASVTFEKNDIHIEASGTITLHAKGKDLILEGKKTFINSKGPAAAKKPDAFDPLDPGNYLSHEADEVEQLKAKKLDQKISGEETFKPPEAAWSASDIKDELSTTSAGNAVLKKLPPTTKFVVAGGESASDLRLITLGGGEDPISYSPIKNEIRIPANVTSLDAAASVAHEALHAYQVQVQARPKSFDDLIEMEVEAKNVGLDVFADLGFPGGCPDGYVDEYKLREHDRAAYDEAVRAYYREEYRDGYWARKLDGGDAS